MTDPPIRLEDLDPMHDGRRSSPSARRNRSEILEVLERYLPESGTVLELASGSGEHAVHFARALPHLTWQPSERDAEALASIHAWRRHEGPDNLDVPVTLDVLTECWPIEDADAIVAINVMHISPWAFTESMLRQARRVLQPGAPLLVYGAVFRSGEDPAPSNLAFDQELRERDPGYGVRSLVDIERAATDARMSIDEVVAMPKNNTLLVIRARIALT